MTNQLPAIQPQSYVYDVQGLVNAFTTAVAHYKAEAATHPENSGGFSMYNCFTAATERELATAQDLLAQGVATITLSQPLAALPCSRQESISARHPSLHEVIQNNAPFWLGSLPQNNN